MYNDFELKIPGNTGLQEETRKDPRDLILGVQDNRSEKYLGARPIISDGHDHTKYEPAYDFQFLIDGDSNGCVSFSAVNCCQYAVNRQLDSITKDSLNKIGMIDQNGKFEANNGIVVVGSGTDPNGGNTVSNVAEWIRTKGLAPRSARIWNNEETKAKFYTPLTSQEKLAGLPFLNYFSIEHEWVPTDGSNILGPRPLHTREQLKEALKYGTVHISVDGNYVRNEDGLISSMVWANGKKYTFSHRITLRDYKEGEWWECHDHYTKQIIKFIWDYPFGNGKLFFVKKKFLPTTPFIQYGRDLYFLGKAGSLIGQYVRGGDGDTWKAVFGDYSKATPITKVETLPTNISGKDLKIT